MRSCRSRRLKISSYAVRAAAPSLGWLNVSSTLTPAGRFACIGANAARAFGRSSRRRRVNGLALENYLAANYRHIGSNVFDLIFRHAHVVRRENDEIGQLSCLKCAFASFFEHVMRSRTRIESEPFFAPDPFGRPVDPPAGTFPVDKVELFKNR